MEALSEEEFDAVLEQALAELPNGIDVYLDNVALFVEAQPPESAPNLLGLYEGVPLTERSEFYGYMMPDTIFLYQSTLVAHARDLTDLREEIVVTIVHEIAHHHGIDDAHLHELGWG